MTRKPTTTWKPSVLLKWEICTSMCFTPGGLGLELIPIGEAVVVLGKVVHQEHGVGLLMEIHGDLLSVCKRR